MPERKDCPVHANQVWGNFSNNAISIIDQKRGTTSLDIAIILIGLGLILDIVGVTLLFFTTSMKKIEAELSIYVLAYLVAPSDDPEREYPFVLQEKEGELVERRQSVQRNRRLQRSALAAVIVGFAFQGAGVAWPYVVELASLITWRPIV